jgi:hypothetical protein
VIARAMVADRSQRYKTVLELKSALETLRQRAPGELPQTLPFAGTIPVELTANALPEAEQLSASAHTSGGTSGLDAGHTGAPLSHTTPGGVDKGRSVLVWGVVGAVALAGVAVTVLLTRGAGPEHEATGEAIPPNDRSRQSPAPNAAGERIVEPTVLPTAAASTPAPSASVVGSPRLPPSAPKPVRSQGKTRAAEHGMSEQNPY